MTGKLAVLLLLCFGSLAFEQGGAAGAIGHRSFLSSTANSLSPRNVFFKQVESQLHKIYIPPGSDESPPRNSVARLCCGKKRDFSVLARNVHSCDCKPERRKLGEQVPDHQKHNEDQQ